MTVTIEDTIMAIVANTLRKQGCDPTTGDVPVQRHFTKHEGIMTITWRPTKETAVWTRMFVVIDGNLLMAGISSPTCRFLPRIIHRKYDLQNPKEIPLRDWLNQLHQLDIAALSAQA